VGLPVQPLPEGGKVVFEKLLSVFHKGLVIEAEALGVVPTPLLQLVDILDPSEGVLGEVRR
jgi:hypothetical protein